MLTKEQEKILKHILSLNLSPQNSVSIGNQMETYPNGVEEKELIRILNVLEQNRYIQLKWYGTNHNNLNIAVDIFILPNGANYFTNKKVSFVKWVIPLAISTTSLIVSIIALIMKLK